uniref:Uncharacterized protein n=1 Tax=Periophthalmus magnuspinnatus TaxID=409849 RepID=A0A3B4A5L2_9GOBI
MDGETCVEQRNGDAAVDLVKPAAPFRYTKDELLEIKELPISNERPECLSEKYDSDGVWDPEKWHASLYPSSERSSPVEGFKKDYGDDRVPLKRRIPDPRERLKEDELDVILSPQRRSFGGGCQGNAAPLSHMRRPISPLENKENESLRLGGARRIGSGRIIAARAFEREPRMEKERERERDFKDKRFRRDFGDKRVFSERRRNDSYAEEEPEWFSGGPTSQSETIELIGFDEKILEDDKRKSRRSKKKTELVKEVECNGEQAEEPSVVLQSTADQEVPHTDVLPEQSAGDFDFNEFFNLETMPGLASKTPEQSMVSLTDSQVPGEQQKNIFQVSILNGLLFQDYVEMRQSLPVNKADLDALAFQQDLALHTHHSFQQRLKMLFRVDSYELECVCSRRINRSPGPQPAGRNSPNNAVTSMVSQKILGLREDPGSRSETDGAHPLSGKAGFAPQSSQSSKDQDRLRSSGHHLPNVGPPGPTTSFPRPVYPVPLIPHVPMVRPPAQLHPNVVQRMLAQGIQPQQLGPALMQAGIIPPHMDLAQLQGLPPALLGPPLYPLNAAGHPLLPPRPNAQMQFAAMQPLQQQRQMHPGGPQSQNQGPHRTSSSQRHGGSPPLGLAKWFGSDVLEQPLPSMPAKVISVDELEFRP